MSIKCAVCVTGPPSGGKSTFIADIARAMPSDITLKRVAFISSGQLARKAAAEVPMSKHNGVLVNMYDKALDAGSMFPAEYQLEQQVAMEINKNHHSDAVLIDGLPRYGHQIEWIKSRIGKVFVIIIAPSEYNLRRNVERREHDIKAVAMQQQREALWYANQFHSVIRACVESDVMFELVGPGHTDWNTMVGNMLEYITTNMEDKA